MSRHATAPTGGFGGEGGWRGYSRRESMTRTKDENPSRRCVTCGEVIEAEGYNELWHRYTNHQVREHGKPSHRDDT